MMCRWIVDFSLEAPRCVLGKIMSAISSNLAISFGQSPGPKSSKAKAQNQLTPDQQKQIQELKKRDADVRIHEAAHLAAAGGFARGGATFSYETGPDGRQYAVGGEVQIDTSPVPHDPRATISKMQTVETAALAPADPSSQDRSVAAAAATKAAQAQAQLNSQHQPADPKGGLLDTFA
jgi:hypothetical protein